jgi:hypothetical protein
MLENVNVFKLKQWGLHSFVQPSIQSPHNPDHNLIVNVKF